MALSLVAAAVLFSGASVSAQSARSVETVCNIIENNRGASETVQEFVSCGLGECSKDFEQTPACPTGQSKISFKVKISGSTRCTERCVFLSGGDGASTSDADDDVDEDEVMEDDAPVDTDAAAVDDSEDSVDDADMPEEMEDGEPEVDDADVDVDVDVADAPAVDDLDLDVAVVTDADTADVPAMADDIMDDEVDEDDDMMPVPADALVGGLGGGAAPPEATTDMAPAEGPLADMPCENLLDALAMIPEAEPLLTVASKFLDPDSLAALGAPDANLTILVPPESVLRKVVGGFEAGMLTEAAIQEVLKLHVIPEALDAMTLLEADGEMVPTLLGDDDPLTVMIEGAAVMFEANNTVTVTMPDQDSCADSQVIHLIDGILIPEGLDVDLAALPEGDLSAVDALPPAEVAAPGPRGLQPTTTDDDNTGGAFGVASGAVGMLMAVAAVLAF